MIITYTGVPPQYETCARQRWTFYVSITPVLADVVCPAPRTVVQRFKISISLSFKLVVYLPQKDA
jgi:hypothetical protein